MRSLREIFTYHQKEGRELALLAEGNMLRNTGRSNVSDWIDETLDKLVHVLLATEANGNIQADVDEAKTAIQKHTDEAVRAGKIEELEEFISYDWYGTDDKGNENVYFNDEICKYSKDRIEEIREGKNG